MSSEFRDELEFARALGRRAGDLAMSYFRSPTKVRTKADGTLVTEADLAVEGLIRDSIHARYPDDGFLGEEGGSIGSTSRRWIIDPLDATSNFVAGIQIWGTLIALTIEQEPVVAVIEAPAIGERYDAARGGGARLNDAKIEVSTVPSLAKAFVSTGGLREWLSPGDDALGRLTRAARRTRSFGDFWGHVLVARGAADAMAERGLRVWDWAAPALVVAEAGGLVTSLDGGPLTDGGSVLSSNGFVHEELLAVFSARSRGE